jgi:regulator of sigma E protease
LLILESLVVFAVILGILVVVHEFGHFTMARLTGMTVHEFAFGFGPIIKKLFKRNGTEYNIRAVPLGGFVRIAGMDPGESEDVEGGFNTKPIWQRALVIFSGPFMSLVLGYVVFLLIGFVWGFPSSIPSTTIGAVAQKSPAAVAHLQADDRIVAIDGKSLRDGRDLQRVTSVSAGKVMHLSVERKGKILLVQATPRLETDPATKKKVGRLGIALQAPSQRVGVVESVKRGTVETYGFVSQMVQHIFSRAITKDVGGIVAIGYLTHETVKAGQWQGLVAELAMLSLMLGIINLIPWPVLDGGHILYLIVEKIRGKRLEPETWYAIQMVGMAVLVFLAVFLVYFDISRIYSHTLFQ